MAILLESNTSAFVKLGEDRGESATAEFLRRRDRPTLPVVDVDHW